MKPILLLTLPLVATPALAKKSPSQPNIIVIMSDDQGYEDLGCYGSPLIKTPAIDKMASEGLRLTDFYQSSSVSSASRAGLLTGRNNAINGVPGVYFPNEGGMPESEITIAEVLKTKGYATGCFGKWHLGDDIKYLPLNQGFDEYMGIPYSNDMYISPRIPLSKDIVINNGYTLDTVQLHQKYAQKRNTAYKNQLRNISPLVEGNEIVEYPVDQRTLSRRYIDRTIEFAKKNHEAGKPFFAYVTPAMPHTPLFASDQFKGKSERGLYGDCIEELDWNIGRLLDALDREGLSENTIVIFTSDNGPWLQRKEEGGSAAPLRSGKYSVYEGGVRVPCIIRWRGIIPEGTVSDAVVRSFDFLPTFAHYGGCKALKHTIDGQNIAKFLENPTKTKGLDEYVYIRNGEVRGVRKGDWIYLPYTGNAAKKEDRPELFNVKADISESNNIINSSPDKLAELKVLFDKYVLVKTL